MLYAARVSAGVRSDEPDRIDERIARGAGMFASPRPAWVGSHLTDQQQTHSDALTWAS